MGVSAMFSVVPCARHVVVKACMFVLFSTSLAQVTGCARFRPPLGSPSDPQGIKHNADTPVPTGSSWRWHVTTEEELLRVSNVGGLRSLATALPPTTPETLKLDALIGRLDTQLRARFPDRLAAVPVPKGRVFTSGGINGFVSGGFLCFDLVAPERTDSSHAHEHRTEDRPRSVLAIRGVDDVHAVDPKQCVFSQNLAHLDAFLDAYKVRLPRCDVKRGPSGIQFRGDCPEALKEERLRQEPALAGQTFTRLAFVSTFNRVSVTDTAVRTLPDPELAALVAHELGHYYRAHASSLLDETNFFYRVGESNANERLRPDPSLKGLGEEVLRIGTMLNAPQPVGDAPHPGMIGMMAPFAASLNQAENSEGRDACGADPGCSQKCEAFADAFADAAPQLSAYVTGRDGSAVNRDVFHSVHGAFSACASALKLCRAPCQSAVAGLSDREAISLLPHTLRHEIERDESAGPQNPDSLASYAVWANARLKRHAQLLLQAAEQRLGYYTVEQEADDAALEHLVWMGYPARAAISLLFRTFAALAHASGTEAGTFLTEVGYGSCRALSEADWKTPEGRPVFVPIADFSGLHHSLCSRIYNMSREIVAHGWE